MNSKYKPGEGRRKKFAFDKGRQLDPLSLEEVKNLLPLNDIRRDHLIEYLHFLQDKFKFESQIWSKSNFNLMTIGYAVIVGGTLFFV